MKRVLFFFFLMGLVVVWGADPSLGEDKQDRKKQARRNMSVPPVYKENCGSCHMAYGAYLLPDAAWMAKLATLHDHYGVPVEIAPAELSLVTEYLATHSADKGNSRLGKKIMKKMSAQTMPDRITDLPYIQRKHRKIPAAVFADAAVGGFNNCISCHSGAEQGDFDDDRVKIPESAMQAPQ